MPRIFEKFGQTSNTFEELHKRAKHPHCNSGFMNKIEVRSNVG